jgi:hypothetical protein
MHSPPYRAPQDNTRRPRAWRAWLGALLALLAWPAAAHEIRPAVVDVHLEDNNRVRITIQANLEAVLAGISTAHRDSKDAPTARTYDALRTLPPAELAARLREFWPQYRDGLRLEFDGAAAGLTLEAVDVPPVGDVALARLSRVTASGRVPDGARTLRWEYPEAYGANVLRLHRPGTEAVTAVWLREGEVSAALPLSGEPVAASGLQVFGQYVTLGFTHILPKGLDHILFVLGLFLLSTRLAPLLWQVTAFTLAHTITLGLSMYGVVSLSPAIVEPLIAASIVYVAVENLVTARLHAWRVLVVFGFGLLHGLGFAGVLTEIGLPREQFVTGLVAFNLGVELGQLSVIALGALLLGYAWRARPWYRGRVVMPASALIALTGLYWTVERVLG